MNEWISIKDRLPEGYKLVFIFSGDLMPQRWDVGFYHAKFDSWEYQGGGTIFKKGVTHWRELDKPK